MVRSGRALLRGKVPASARLVEELGVSVNKVEQPIRVPGSVAEEQGSAGIIVRWSSS